MMEIDGGCHCGAIAYRGKVDPEKVGLCQCTDCQVLSGGPYRASVLVDAKDFVLVKGKPKVYIKKTAESGNKREQGFCGECGSPIYSTDPVKRQAYFVRVGGIRQRAQLAPKRRIWSRSALPWAENLSGIARSEKE